MASGWKAVLALAALAATVTSQQHGTLDKPLQQYELGNGQSVTLTPQTVLLPNITRMYVCNASTAAWIPSEAVAAYKISNQSLLLSEGGNGLFHNVSSLSPFLSTYLYAELRRVPFSNAIAAVNFSGPMNFSAPPIHPLLSTAVRPNVSAADLAAVNGTLIPANVSVYRLLSTRVNENVTTVFLYLNRSQTMGFAANLTSGSILLHNKSSTQLEFLHNTTADGDSRAVYFTQLTAVTNLTAAAQVSIGSNGTQHEACVGMDVYEGAGLWQVPLTWRPRIGSAVPGRPGPVPLLLVTNATTSADGRWIVVEGYEDASLPRLLYLNRTHHPAAVAQEQLQRPMYEKPLNLTEMHGTSAVRRVTRGLIPGFHGRADGAWRSGVSSGDKSASFGVPRKPVVIRTSQEVSFTFLYELAMHTELHGVFRRSPGHWWEASTWQEVGISLYGSMLAYADARITTAMSTDISGGPTVFFAHHFPHIVFLGPVPLWFTPIVEAAWQFHLSASVTAEASAVAQATADLKLTGGWRRGSGAYADAAASWSGSVSAGAGVSCSVDAGVGVPVSFMIAVDDTLFDPQGLVNVQLVPQGAVGVSGVDPNTSCPLHSPLTRQASFGLHQTTAAFGLPLVGASVSTDIPGFAYEKEYSSGCEPSPGKACGVCPPDRVCNGRCCKAGNVCIDDAVCCKEGAKVCPGGAGVQPFCCSQDLDCGSSQCMCGSFACAGSDDICCDDSIFRGPYCCPKDTACNFGLGCYKPPCIGCDDDDGDG